MDRQEQTANAQTASAGQNNSMPENENRLYFSSNIHPNNNQTIYYHNSQNVRLDMLSQNKNFQNNSINNLPKNAIIVRKNGRNLIPIGNFSNGLVMKNEEDRKPILVDKAKVLNHIISNPSSPTFEENTNDTTNSSITEDLPAPSDINLPHNRQKPQIRAKETDNQVPNSPIENKLPTKPKRVRNSENSEAKKLLQERLMSEFEITKYPSVQKVEEIAESLKLTVKKVRSWFQARRNKARKMQGLVGNGKRLGDVENGSNVENGGQNGANKTQTAGLNIDLYDQNSSSSLTNSSNLPSNFREQSHEHKFDNSLVQIKEERQRDSISISRNVSLDSDNIPNTFPEYAFKNNQDNSNSIHSSSNMTFNANQTILVDASNNSKINFSPAFSNAHYSSSSVSQGGNVSYNSPPGLLQPPTPNTSNVEVYDQNGRINTTVHVNNLGQDKTKLIPFQYDQNNVTIDCNIQSKISLDTSPSILETNFTSKIPHNSPRLSLHTPNSSKREDQIPMSAPVISKFNEEFNFDFDNGENFQDTVSTNFTNSAGQTSLYDNQNNSKVDLNFLISYKSLHNLKSIEPDINSIDSYYKINKRVKHRTVQNYGENNRRNSSYN